MTLVREVPKDDRAAGKRLPGGEAYVRVLELRPGRRRSDSRGQSRGVRTAAGGPTATGVIIDLRGIADGTPEDGIAAARLVRQIGRHDRDARAGRARDRSRPTTKASGRRRRD